ncbi:hypothetical protein CSB20_01050 [bacterium DOLZORAL124_64_63]|nr:MAG: hypothetical protein CSB20_01050 [bacterium DOLZORAL124_64_63]
MLRDINLADRLLRHSVANHRRETIAFAKRRNAAAERIILFMVWRNYHKGVSEKDSRSPSPAMMLGLTDHRLSIEEMFGERLFPDDVDLPPRWRQYYRREVETVALPINRRHDLRFAF